MNKKALLVIDIQNDYFKNGSWELVGSAEASLKAAKVIEHFRANDLPIAHIQHLAADPSALLFHLGQLVRRSTRM